jgi:hypothetical protein
MPVAFKTKTGEKVTSFGKIIIFVKHIFLLCMNPTNICYCLNPFTNYIMFIIWYPYPFSPSYYFNKMIACYRKRKKGLPK